MTTPSSPVGAGNRNLLYTPINGGEPELCELPLEGQAAEALVCSEENTSNLPNDTFLAAGTASGQKPSSSGSLSGPGGVALGMVTPIVIKSPTTLEEVTTALLKVEAKLRAIDAAKVYTPTSHGPRVSVGAYQEALSEAQQVLMEEEGLVVTQRWGNVVTKGIDFNKLKSVEESLQRQRQSLGTKKIQLESQASQAAEAQAKAAAEAKPAAPRRPPPPPQPTQKAGTGAATGEPTTVLDAALLEEVPEAPAEKLPGAAEAPKTGFNLETGELRSAPQTPRNGWWQRASQMGSNARNYLNRFSGVVGGVAVGAGAVAGALDLKARYVDKPYGEQDWEDVGMMVADVALIGGGFALGAKLAAKAAGAVEYAAFFGRAATNLTLFGGGVAMTVKGVSDFAAASEASNRGLTITQKELAGDVFEVGGGVGVLYALGVPSGWGALAGGLVFGAGALMAESGKEDGATTDLINQLNPMLQLNAPSMLPIVGRLILELNRNGERLDDEVVYAVVKHLEAKGQLNHALLQAPIFLSDKHPGKEPGTEYEVPEEWRDKNLLEIFQTVVANGWYISSEDQEALDLIAVAQQNAT